MQPIPIVEPPQVPGIQVAPNRVQVQPQVVVQDVTKAVSTVKKNYTSPAFWYHLAVQGMAWLAYFQAADPSLKFSSLGVAVTAFLGYLVHIAKA